MDEQLKEQADKRVKEGWIRASFMIEVLAVNEETAKTALENHIKFLDKEKKTLLYKTDYKGIKKVENPRPDIKEGAQTQEGNAEEHLQKLLQHTRELLYFIVSFSPLNHQLGAEFFPEDISFLKVDIRIIIREKCHYPACAPRDLVPLQVSIEPGFYNFLFLTSN